MNKTRMLLGCLLALTLLSGCNAQPPETTVPPTEAPTEAPTETPPDSLLYYGEIKEIGESSLSMDSDRSGPWVMELTDGTAFVDSGERTLFDPAILKAGDRIYVFHSPVAAYTMPPKSQAFAVLRNIPMDVSCGMYHEVEALRQEGDTLLITTDNGGLTLGADADTRIFTPDGETAQLEVGDYVIAWYWNRGEEVLHPSHLMRLP